MIELQILLQNKFRLKIENKSMKLVQGVAHIFVYLNNMIFPKHEQMVPKKLDDNFRMIADILSLIHI